MSARSPKKPRASTPATKVQHKASRKAKAKPQALVAIRDHSTLNVRILTRSALAREDFDIYKSFGSRLLLGTSLPTLDPKISAIYESKTQAPAHRLKLLIDAHNAGINTYVAIAPVPPESGYEGMLSVFEAVKEAKPWTIFMEPINLRLGIAERIQDTAKSLHREIDTSIYDGGPRWVAYAVQCLRDAERAAKATGQLERLHLWPDFDELSRDSVINAQPDPAAFRAWLWSYWDRISAWPEKARR